ncbi:DNA alkylation repair protein [Candidatus Saccharibacteria bacterium]|nr:DNA alkylation repair protein [Candidatus Saccharibacteria bacterium]
MDLESLKAELRTYINPGKAEFLPYFFKTGPGQYGEGDKFLGVVMPDSRKVAKQFQGMALKDVEELLHSPWHEERMVALLILVEKYKKANKMGRSSRHSELVSESGLKILKQVQDDSVSIWNGNECGQIYNLYLDNTQFINNWDLVDLSAPGIVGRYVFDHREELPRIIKLTSSPLLWNRRVAMLASFYFIKNGEVEPALTIVEKLLNDKEDLIHKATGWMLREIYKRIDEQIVEDFIKQHYHDMPRTTLRYAIERMPEEKRKRFLKGEF